MGSNIDNTVDRERIQLIKLENYTCQVLLMTDGVEDFYPSDTRRGSEIRNLQRGWRVDDGIRKYRYQGKRSYV